MTYGKSISLDLGFEDAVAAVRAALAEQGFGVVTEIDMQATMKNRLGESYEPYLILGACNPPLAHQALQTDAGIGMLLPCNVVVRQVDGKVLVEALDPQIMVESTGVNALAPVADEAGTRLDAMLKSLA